MKSSSSANPFPKHILIAFTLIELENQQFYNNKLFMGNPCDAKSKSAFTAIKYSRTLKMLLT